MLLLLLLPAGLLACWPAGLLACWPVGLSGCCLLPVACCLLPVACCLFPVACCQLPVACCLLPVAVVVVAVVAVAAVPQAEVSAIVASPVCRRCGGTADVELSFRSHVFVVCDLPGGLVISRDPNGYTLRIPTWHNIEEPTTLQRRRPWKHLSALCQRRIRDTLRKIFSNPAFGCANFSHLQAAAALSLWVLAMLPRKRLPGVPQPSSRLRIYVSRHLRQLRSRRASIHQLAALHFCRSWPQPLGWGSQSRPMKATSFDPP